MKNPVYALRTMLMILVATSLFSCNQQVMFTNTQALKGGSSTSTADTTTAERLLRIDDRISVSVWNNEELSVGSVHNVHSVQEEAGKWLMIDENGEVNLPMVGFVRLEGLTATQAREKLTKEYTKYIKTPIINLRVLSNQITVLGEVQKPGIYSFSNNRISIVDLIARAQGTTEYAKVSKVKILRDEQNIPVDLSNTAYKDISLIPGDVVYIPPSGKKNFDRFSDKLIPLASLITAAALVYSISVDN